jgi:phosphopantetheine adenylyltransferase
MIQNNDDEMIRKCLPPAQNSGRGVNILAYLVWELENVRLGGTFDIHQERRSLLDLDAWVTQILGLDILVFQGQFAEYNLAAQVENIIEEFNRIGQTLGCAKFLQLTLDHPARASRADEDVYFIVQGKP